MLFLPIFNLLVFLLYPLLLFPFFHIKTDRHIILWTCIFAFRSLSLHRLLRFHSGETLLPAPTTSLFSASFVLTTSMIFPHLSCSLQLMEFFLLKTTSDVAKLLKEKQSAWAGEEFVCVCICVCVLSFFSTFPIQITSSSEVSYLSLMHSIHRHSKNILRVAYALSHLDLAHTQYFKVVGSSPQ